MKKRTGFILFFIIVLIILTKPVNASRKLEGIENFPESYQPYLREIQKNHPNWNFTALYTDLDWNYVINNQNIFGKNLVPKNYSNEWKNTKEGEHDVEVDVGWVDSSRKAIEYTMDARNFLYEGRFFQFETLSYNEKSNNLDGIEKILYGTEFYNRIVEYKDSSGNNIVTNKKYAEAILAGGITSQVSPYHLASRIKQEVGPFLSHNSISGTTSGYEGYYNFYNIGATSSSIPGEAIRRGLQYAKDGKGASASIKEKYWIPWNNKERSITGGGIFIGSSYINVGQNTIYLQKFDVNDEKPGDLFWHQYMTNVLAPYNESRLIYNGYNNSGLLQTEMSFLIPIYDNMPNIPIQNPNILESDFTQDNTKMYPNVTGNLNVRTGPGTSYEMLTQITKQDVVTRIRKGKQKGDLWDQVILSNGMTGYVFQSYLLPVPEIEVSDIILSLEKDIINKNERTKLNYEIIPAEAKDTEVIFESSDTSIAQINAEGSILGVRSGKADISVRTKDGKIKRSIGIEIYSKVNEVSIDSGNLSLLVGDNRTLHAIILPDDANNKNTVWSSSNPTVASINQEGNLVALAEGESEITVKTEEGQKEDTIQVKVRKKLEENEIRFENGLQVQGNEITGINDKANSVKEIQESIVTNYEIEIQNPKGEVITDMSKVGTASTVIVKDSEGNIKAEYQTLLYGDVNGDGRINSVDLLVLQRHILELSKINGLYIKAGNTSKNGKNPNSVDLLRIQRHILELSLLEQ